MSTFQTTIERLEVRAHPDPEVERLEVVRVGEMGYEAVVAKGAFRTGDLAGYIPESAVLDAELIDALGLTGMLAGKGKDRVKPKRLRGVLSQGVVFDLDTVSRWLPEDFDLSSAFIERTDLNAWLPVAKWEPIAPASMSGVARSAPDLIRWIDIESRFRFPGVFSAGESVHVSEKIHGTACLVTVDMTSNELWVSSKGFGAKGLSLEEDERNLYWRAVRAHGVDTAARTIAQRFDATTVGLFGEVHGAGVQDLDYGVSRGNPGYAAFDALVIGSDGARRWLEQAEMRLALDGMVDTAPTIYEGPFDEDLVLGLADGVETVSGTGRHIREGVVVRAVPERRSTLLGGRAILKYVSGSYLTRGGGTEYE